MLQDVNHIIISFPSLPPHYLQHYHYHSHRLWAVENNRIIVVCFQVLARYDDFKLEARAKRERLEDSRRFQYFKRDADELESWVHEKLQAASDESYKDPTNLQVATALHIVYGI